MTASLLALTGNAAVGDVPWRGLILFYFKFNFYFYFVLERDGVSTADATNSPFHVVSMIGQIIGGLTVRSQ